MNIYQNKQSFNFKKIKRYQKGESNRETRIFHPLSSKIERKKMSNNGSAIAIPSTGQTYYDLACLINLLSIYTHGGSQTSFVPQSFVDPHYVPVTATTTAFIVSGLTIFASTTLLACQLIMRFDSRTANLSKYDPFRQGRLLLEDYAILIGYVCFLQLV